MCPWGSAAGGIRAGRSPLAGIRRSERACVAAPCSRIIAAPALRTYRGATLRRCLALRAHTATFRRRLVTRVAPEILLRALAYEAFHLGVDPGRGSCGLL